MSHHDKEAPVERTCTLCQKSHLCIAHIQIAKTINSCKFLFPLSLEPTPGKVSDIHAAVAASCREFCPVEDE
jgi:hypothetical protein